MDFNHTIDWEKSEILKVENNYSKWLISEAFSSSSSRIFYF